VVFNIVNIIENRSMGKYAKANPRKNQVVVNGVKHEKSGSGMDDSKWTEQGRTMKNV